MDADYIFPPSKEPLYQQKNMLVCVGSNIKIVRIQVNEQNILLNCWSAFYTLLLEGICYLFWYL